MHYKGYVLNEKEYEAIKDCLIIGNIPYLDKEMKSKFKIKANDFICIKNIFYFFNLMIVITNKLYH